MIYSPISLEVEQKMDARYLSNLCWEFETEDKARAFFDMLVNNLDGATKLARRMAAYREFNVKALSDGITKKYFVEIRS